MDHLRWYRFLRARHPGSCSSLAKVHKQWWRPCRKIVVCRYEFALSDSVIVLFVSVVVSMDINRTHYFRRDPRIFIFSSVYSVFLYCFVSPFFYILVSFQFLYKVTEFWQRVETQLHEVNILNVKCFRQGAGVAQRVGRSIALLFHDRNTRRCEW